MIFRHSSRDHTKKTGHKCEGKFLDGFPFTPLHSLNPKVLTQNEFEVLIEDETKRIEGDLAWGEDEDHSPSVEFRAEVKSQAGYPLSIRASFNPHAKAAAFSLIHRAAGRIYGLCLGKNHKNPSGELVGEKHKHRWTEQFKDKQAYVPSDITAGASNLLLAWQQFAQRLRLFMSVNSTLPLLCKRIYSNDECV